MWRSFRQSVFNGSLEYTSRCFLEVLRVSVVSDFQDSFNIRITCGALLKQESSNPSEILIWEVWRQVWLVFTNPLVSSDYRASVGNRAKFKPGVVALKLRGGNSAMRQVWSGGHPNCHPHKTVLPTQLSPVIIRGIRGISNASAVCKVIKGTLDLMNLE